MIERRILVLRDLWAKTADFVPPIIVALAGIIIPVIAKLLGRPSDVANVVGIVLVCVGLGIVLGMILVNNADRRSKAATDARHS